MHKIHSKQKTYALHQLNQLRRYIIVEIVNEREIRECVNFVLPTGEDSQFMYFNEDLTMMIVWIYSNNNIYLYRFTSLKD